MKGGDGLLAFYLFMLDTETEKRTFEQIYLKYHDDILKRTYRILRNDEDVKDVMQETWLRVLKSMELFCDKDEGTVKAYIMSIARNQSISVFRKRRKEKALFNHCQSEELIDDEDLFSICEDEGISRVMECVDMLSDAQKDVIIMYYLYHHSIKEIAELFGISEVVAESRWNHGRVRLMKLLTRRGVYVRKENDRA
ncbi:MAG: sigma-70 family RNA polymerase sigma factor [Ruminococcaceae bacterium]|nr:sigma-70 family RNA polymerase sigma factor [Oscillospiraceae bacterium]